MCAQTRLLVHRFIILARRPWRAALVGTLPRQTSGMYDVVPAGLTVAGPPYVFFAFRRDGAVAVEVARSHQLHRPVLAGDDIFVEWRPACEVDLHKPIPESVVHRIVHVHFRHRIRQSHLIAVSGDFDLVMHGY